MMKPFLSSLAIVWTGLTVAGVASAAEEIELKNFRADYGNIASMQRGARDFMAYCSGCHSMKYLRYNRLSEDLGIPEDLLKANLMYATDKVGDPIRSAMPPASEQWFGKVPPDLSLEARSRGPEWIYTYLQSFYIDESRPLGVNNTVLKGAAMPHVLWELQGWQKKIGETPLDKNGDPGADNKKEANGDSHKASEGQRRTAEKGPHQDSEFELVSQGSLSPEAYRDFVADITNFMDYAGEPGKRDRIHTGFKVILFLFLLLILTYLLKKEFWRDIH